MTPGNAQRPSSVFVFSSPLQYFLCRLIAQTYPAGPKVGIQYNEFGDFSKAFHAIDQILGPSPFSTRIFAIGQSIDIGPIERLFLSNRFNQTEIELYMLLKPQTQHLCAFEDGLALYLEHNFREASWHDGNVRMVLKNKLKEFMRRHTRFRSGNIRPYYFSNQCFDEFYSIFPDIPKRRQDSTLFSLEAAFRGLATVTHEAAPGSTLILSQSLVKDGMISEEAYAAFLLDRIAEIQKTSETVLFKPHPRDEPGMVESILKRSGCALLAPAFQPVPVELYLACHPGSTVLGFWSSSLAYAARGLGQKSYTFGPALLSQGCASPRFEAVWASMKPMLDRYGVAPYTCPA